MLATIIIAHAILAGLAWVLAEPSGDLRWELAAVGLIGVSAWAAKIVVGFWMIGG